jgi:secondary thiamine-phosphate synthase enzyme
MKTFTSKLNLKTQKQFEIIDITSKVAESVKSAGITSGTVTVFAPHSTASIKINHYEPLLLQDLMKTLYRLVPVDLTYAHDAFESRLGVAAEERSNGHAHVKAFLLGASEIVPIEKAKMLLGPRQNIFFVELDGGRARSVLVTVMGE